MDLEIFGKLRSGTWGAIKWKIFPYSGRGKFRRKISNRGRLDDVKHGINARMSYEAMEEVTKSDIV